MVDDFQAPAEKFITHLLTYKTCCPKCGNYEKMDDDGIHHALQPSPFSWGFWCLCCGWKESKENNG